MTVHNRKATHQIGRSTVINFAGSTLAALVLFLSVPVYLRLVGEIRYGVLTLLWLLLTYLGAIDLGIGRATTNRLASLGKCPAEQTENVFWTALAVCLGSGLVGSVLLYFFFQVLLDHFLSGVPLALRQELGLALPWLVWAPPIITATSVLTGALQGKGAFLALNVGQLAATILYQVTPLVLAMSGYVSLNYLIAGMIGGRLAGAIFLFFLCRTHIPLKSRPSVDVGEIPPLLRYGGWISLTNLAGPLLTVFDRFVIAAQSGAASVTAYTVPFNLVSGLMLLPASLQNALLPRFAALQENEAQRLNVQATVAVMVLMTPAITAFLFLVKPALILWVGQELANRAAPVAHILLLGLWLNAIAFVPFSFLLGRNRPDVPAKFHLLELAPYLLTLWFLVHQFGIVGAAIAWSLRVWVDTMLLFSATGLLQLFIKLSLISITMFAVFNLSMAFAHGLVGYGMSGILTVSLSVLVSVILLYQQFGPTIFRRETILFFFSGNHRAKGIMSEPSADSVPSWPSHGLENQDHCPVCGEKPRTPLYADLTDRLFHAPGKWSLYRCQGCHGAYLDPRPTPETIGLAYSEYYTHQQAKQTDLQTLWGRLKSGLKNSYFNHKYHLTLVPTFALGYWFIRMLPGKKAILDLLARHLPVNRTGTVMDIGCGNGDFLKIALSLGWQAHGIDPDPAAVEVARSTGAMVQQGTLPHTGLLSNHFDMVTLSHVIEHVHDPLEALRECLRILKPGGALWVATPNLESFGHEKFGQHWRGLEPPRHLVLFNRSSLALALKQAGFVSSEFQAEHPTTHWMYEQSLRICTNAPLGDGERPLPFGLRLAAYWAEFQNILSPERCEFMTVVARKPA